MTDQRTVTTMFDGIAPRYDLLNHLLSFNIDKIWRRKVSKAISKGHPATILDVATGTADLAIQLARDNTQAVVTGVDLSQAMLDIGKEKVAKKGLGRQIQLMLGDAQHLTFPDHSFDAVSVAFGVRNFEDLSAGLNEMKRVVRPGGTIHILEFSQPGHFPMKQLYGIYTRHFLPVIGRIVSKHPSAYTYLPRSIKTFNEKNDLVTMMRDMGLVNVDQRTFCGGIAVSCSAVSC